MNKYEKSFNILEKSYEKFYNINENLNSFELFNGEQSGVIFSCPHAVSQTREGKEKLADIHTGPLGFALNSLGFPVLVKTKNCGDDANYDRKSDYKDFLSKHIRQKHISYLIDLHGMSKKRDVLISLGTCFGNNSNKSLELINQFIKLAHRNGIDANRIRIDFPFFASKRTVSSTIARRNKIETLQVEINSQLFDNENSTIAVIKTLAEFAKLAAKVKQFNVEKIKTKEIFNNELMFCNGSAKNVFEINDHNSGLLLTSPHSCSMFKEGKECYKETFSGALVKTLSDKLKLSSCCKTLRTEYDSTQDYLEKVYDFTTQNKLKFIIEFHVMNKKRCEDVTILTNQGFSINNNFEIMSILLKTLMLNKFKKVSLDYPFNPFNLNSSVAIIYKQTKVPALQFIINQRVFNNKNKLKRLLKALNEIILKLNCLI